MQKKKRIGVLFGGQSGEHEISRISAYNVMAVINREKYDITMIGITKDGRWAVYTGDADKIPDGSWERDTEHCRYGFSLMGDPELTAIDLFFPVLHGPMGEDGTVQGLFELLGKPYVGSGVLASAVGMDKAVAKVCFSAEDIPVVPSMTLYPDRWASKRDVLVENMESFLGYPMFIKPVNMGSSVGISKAHNREELISGIDEAFRFDRKVLVEKGINAREIEVAVLRMGERVKTAFPGEIVASKEFYDYEAKYADDQHSEIIIPAPITDGEAKTIRHYAARAYRAIDGDGPMRVDFFIDRDDGEIYLNEVNTMPGFTGISMYPMMWENEGVSYAELIERMIEGADVKKVTAYTLG